LWELEAKSLGRPVWQLAGLTEKPRSLLTTFTCGADTPERMAAVARGKYGTARAIKLKLTGEVQDADRVRAVRESRPEVWLGVDGNQGFATRAALERLLPVLVEARVNLIEQPFPARQDVLLDGFDSPIPIAADESVQSLTDLERLAKRVQVINIKLDKCGGLTEALAMVKAARDHGLDCMVGNMIGTSLAMAPAYLVGQSCTVVDLDGPVFLESDRDKRVSYDNGFIECSETLWGT
jgi:L-alanine-DL-glutamate epimerase-like enolase superfamily enzyme